MSDHSIGRRRRVSSKGLCKEKKFPKSEITMEVGGSVQVSLELFFCVENRPKIAINHCSYFGVVYLSLSVMGLKKFGWVVGGWVG